MTRLILPVLLISAVSVAFAQEAPPRVEVKVREWKQPDGRVRYAYRVINHSRDRSGGKDRQVVSLIIGEDHHHDLSELRVPPIGWSFEKGLSKPSVSSPAGWHPAFITTEESDRCELEWRGDGESDKLKSGQALSGFSVVTPKPDENYRAGHWTVIFSDSTFESSSLVPDDHPLPLECLGAADRSSKSCEEKRRLENASDGHSERHEK